MNFNIYVYINAKQLVKKGFKVKCGISKLALRGTQTMAISQSASYATKELYNKFILVDKILDKTKNFLFKRNVG